MLNTTRALTIASLWISVVYIICFGGVALLPGIRPWFMQYALHTRADLGTNIMTLGTFVTGLIIWNILALLAVWLFVLLSNYVKK
ncbi:MAG: hypothetical protein A3A24_00775 [Candidatus Buchananbacteria bacterium RIFCSPLOWO2_01_FULL_46_12]|uniref:Uncharacterized protein n=1 Tax=Candidatus Buchananbacteria bacterium RIFCSPLOWO2_01_FULL_46_12 TaxID=1797546 RepID=A0A1G1YP96_9BACT|nr:MAG: hypothetical protein A3A24_00775 [Candidatus Buchananbacteria bacterium RIFCSPLOWO2_01_FULL_46_12]